MFISQVMFESETENREVIQRILEIKKSEIQSAAGLISYECWWKQNSKTAGFALVGKWTDKEAFKTWMKDTHKDGHQKPDIGDVKIVKSALQFEAME